MTYRDRLRNGSFRGVAFFTPEHELEGGRRGVVHEYPGRDTHSTQDLGKRAQRFSVTAKIIGDDYDLQRDQLIEALEKGGPGKLVHRYHGEMQAEVEPGKTYRLVETQEDGRVATFTIPFIRAGESKAPTVGVDSAERAKAAATAAKGASLSSFASTAKTSGPEFVRNEIVGAIQRANSVVGGLNSKVNSSLSITSGVDGMITALGNNVATLVATPTKVFDLGDDLYAIPEALFGAVATVGSAFKSVATAFGVGRSRSGTGSATTSSTAGGGSTGASSAQVQSAQESANAEAALWDAGPAAQAARTAQARTEARKVISVARQAQSEAESAVGADDPLIQTTNDLSVQRQRNQAAVAKLVKQAATIETVRAAVDMPYDSHAAAIAMRDQLDAALDKLAEESEDDDVYSRLMDLRAELGRHLLQTAGELPRIVDHTPLITTPALLLAHRIYGDASRHEDIVARNKIPHPGFVAGGETIQVLSDG